MNEATAMGFKRIARLSVVAATFALSGCAWDGFGIGAPILDSHFGEAVTQARAMQVINPEGAAVNDEGYSGRAAHGAVERLYAPAGKPSSGSSHSQAQAGSGASSGSGSNSGSGSSGSDKAK